MEISFVGAAREVTGSCHLLHVGGRTVALDCGLFQGRRAATRERNAQLPWPADALDAVILSHAHIDHAGRLPLLARAGWARTIWCTPATRDLAAVMLADSAHIQEQDADFLARHRRSYVAPLYDAADAARAAERMVGVPYGRPFEVVPGVRATFVDAGHILGSASVIVDCTEDGATRRLVFSGDVGRSGLPIIRDPVVPDGAHAVIMESTYGNRDHPPPVDMRARLAGIVNAAANRGGRILIPAFAVGRTQELIYDLHLLAREQAIPPLPIFVDSPLASQATAVFEMHPEIFDRAEELIQREPEPFRFGQVHYTRDVQESKALNTLRGPVIIIAASGMAESGRILHHLRHGASEPRNTILIVGFQAEHTLGRRIVERQPTIRVLGEEIPLRARVEVLDGYSAHAGQRELLQWLDTLRAGSPALGPVWLVHGEPEAQQALAGRMTDCGYRVTAPAAGMRAPF